MRLIEIVIVFVVIFLAASLVNHAYTLRSNNKETETACVSAIRSVDKESVIIEKHVPPSTQRMLGVAFINDRRSEYLCLIEGNGRLVLIVNDDVVVGG